MLKFLLQTNIYKLLYVKLFPVVKLNKKYYVYLDLQDCFYISQQYKTDILITEMKKTHTKNMLSMAPTLHMFSKHGKQQKTASMYQNQPTSSSSKNPNLSTNIKYNRSISSFDKVRKNYKDSPEKKYSGFKSRPTLPKGIMDNNPFDKIIEMFNYEISGKTQEKLYDDMISRLDNCIKVMQQSIQNQSLIQIFRQIKIYFSRIFSIILKLIQKQTKFYYQQLTQICQQYQTKIKQTQKYTKQQIKRHYLYSESEIGKQLEQIKNKANFNTQIFNQMQMCNIDLMRWVKESQTIDNFINDNQNYGENMDSLNFIGNKQQIQIYNKQKQKQKNKYKQKEKEKEKSDKKMQQKAQKSPTLKKKQQFNQPKPTNNHLKPSNNQLDIEQIQQQFDEQINLSKPLKDKKAQKLTQTINYQKINNNNNSSDKQIVRNKLNRSN